MKKFLNIVCWIIAAISAMGIAAIVDLIVNYVICNTTDWRVFNKTTWVVITSIGRFVIGFFFCAKMGKTIYKQLTEE